MGNKFRFSQVWLFQSSIDAKNESIWEIRSEAKPLKIKKIEKSKCLKRLKFARRPTVKGGSSTHTHPTNLTVLLLRLLRPSFSRPYYFSLKNLISVSFEYFLFFELLTKKFLLVIFSRTKLCPNQVATF